MSCDLPRPPARTPQYPAATDPVVGASHAEANDGAPAFDLDPEQRAVLNLVKTGKNVLFSGSGGVGKSAVLRTIIAWLKTKHDAGCAQPSPQAGLLSVCVPVSRTTAAFSFLFSRTLF